MKKILTTFILLIISAHVFADRYIDDGLESSSGGFFDIIIGIVFSIAALFFFGNSFSKWKERQNKGEKPKSLDNTGDWILHLIAYALVSIFACPAILLIFRLIGGATFVREYWYWAFLICFGVLTFLRRT